MTAANICPVLVAELRHADHIIKVMLNALTAQQKTKLAQQLEAANVAGDDIMRRRERVAAIAAAEAELAPAPAGVSKPSARRYLLEIEAFISDIDGQGEHIEILLAALLEKLDGLNEVEGDSVVPIINCFATCALRNAVLIREAGEQILEHVEAGMAA